MNRSTCRSGIATSLDPHANRGEREGGGTGAEDRNSEGLIGQLGGGGGGWVGGSFCTALNWVLTEPGSFEVYCLRLVGGFCSFFLLLAVRQGNNVWLTSRNPQSPRPKKAE